MDKKYIIVTGASSGIGESCAQLLAAEGHNLILLARRIERLEKLKSELEAKHNVEVLVYQVDLAQLDQIESFFAQIKDKKISALINNAGLALGKSSFEDYQWEDFQQMIEVNVKGFTKVAQLAMPQLKESKGHIVNISSVSGIEAYEGGSVYCGTKAYVKMLSKGLRIDLMGTGVRVTDIAPGAVDTEFSNVRFKGDEQKAAAVYEGYTPLYAKDIAEAILFALSRPASVNIEYMLIMATAQASSTRVARNK